jgi:DNA ligase D-like protein (predicted 3'-phosphoesterase)
MPLFVVHEHHATRLHWDFRLELDNVLKSWAMPKKPPRKAGIKRLAMKVEDHALEYADFEGEITSTEYGAGSVMIWDKGQYELLIHAGNSLKIKLFGNLLKGIYVLCQFPSAGPNAWLFFKTKRR